MSIRIGGYDFEGPYPISETWRLRDASGVYAILTRNGSKYRLVDVGESATVKSRVENHDREDCWRREEVSGLYVAVLYCNELLTFGSGFCKPLQYGADAVGATID